jgi:hypothetical protein
MNKWVWIMVMVGSAFSSWLLLKIVLPALGIDVHFVVPSKWFPKRN